MNLVIGGGSYKGLIFLGVLHYLTKSKKLKKIENFYGCSIGSMIGILMLMDVSPENIFNELNNLNLSEYINLNINDLLTNYTLVGDRFFNYWRSYFGKLEDIKMTIKEFNKKYVCKVNIFSTCVNDRKTIIFNEDEYPDVPIIEAVIASCTIPFIFKPIKINDKYYVDGEVKCYFHELNKYITEDTIIIKLSTVKFCDESITTFAGYLKEIILTSMQDIEIIKNDLTLEIELPDKWKNKYDFADLTSYDKTELFLYGIKEASAFYANKIE